MHPFFGIKNHIPIFGIQKYHPSFGIKIISFLYRIFRDSKIVSLFWIQKSYPNLKLLGGIPWNADDTAEKFGSKIRCHSEHWLHQPKPDRKFSLSFIKKITNSLAKYSTVFYRKNLLFLHEKKNEFVLEKLQKIGQILN